MLTFIAKAALWLDTWLQQTFGRPYNALLGAGLIFEIIRGAGELHDRIVAHLASPATLAGLSLQLLMAAALLIHQIGALSHRLEQRGEGRRGRRRTE